MLLSALYDFFHYRAFRAKMLILGHTIKGFDLYTLKVRLLMTTLTDYVLALTATKN